MTERRDDMLRKIRAIMAKANDASVTPEEAETFRAKADELMNKFVIEEWELEQSGGTIEQPEARDVDITWWLDSQINRDVRSSLWSLMQACYDHSRCKIAYHKQNYANGMYTIKVVGYPSDMDYADLLFTSLSIQMTGQVDPKPDPALDWYDNAVRMREAGLTWETIIRRMAQADLLPDRYRDDPYSKTTYHGLSNTVKRRYGKKFVAQHSTWARSFCEGFTSHMWTRFYKLRKDADAPGDNRFALAIVDRAKVVEALLNELFPKPEEKPTKGRKGSYAVDRRARDYAASIAGRAVAEKADISGHHGRRVGNNAPRLEG